MSVKDVYHLIYTANKIINNVTLSATYDSSLFSFVLFSVWCLIYGIPFCITSFCHVCYFGQLQVGETGVAGDVSCGHVLMWATLVSRSLSLANKHWSAAVVLNDMSKDSHSTRFESILSQFRYYHRAQLQVHVSQVFKGLNCWVFTQVDEYWNDCCCGWSWTVTGTYPYYTTS